MSQSASEEEIWTLPSGPYPGLRPFLAHEAALLFGRDQQVNDILKRLRRSRFVAVVGGSGSGKSSLIYAGVEPALRSFGVRGAGDFWLSVIATPGTEAAGAVAHASTADATQGHNSPIVRFAAKFEALLRPEKDLIEQGLRKRYARPPDRTRVDEIADVFRQEGGFARLIEEYGPELKLPPGLEAVEAHYLFVIDQFEEIFHPTNARNEECACMVERIIEHFFNPHKRCYVALTMRSEHLNDCPRFLGLPEAINRSLYLVPRLDEPQLKDAIVGPARRYLRLVMRQAEDPSALPETVDVDEDVVARLLSDTVQIADPDHLPLFQHALFRLWEAACLRVSRRGEAIPARIVWDDLCVACLACDDRKEIGTDNILRGSLESWAQRQYAACTDVQREQIDAMLQRLAYKDPNTGAYTQQRLEISECSGFLGEDCDPKQVCDLMNKVFVEPANYLFWDTGTPDKTTLKVSHESFIRGWAHFRKLIDTEANRFEEFVTTLKLCQSWLSAEEKDETRLLSATDLGRMREKNIREVLENSATRQAWFKMLSLDRDGETLAGVETHLDKFLKLSIEKQETEAFHRKAVKVSLYGALALVVLVVPFALFSLFVQGPVVDRAEHLYEAGVLLGTTPVPSIYDSIGSNSDTVGRLLLSAELIKFGRYGDPDMMQQFSSHVLKWFDWLPPVRRHEDFLVKMASLVEPPANGTMRSILSTVIWGADGFPPAGAFAQPNVFRDVKCSSRASPNDLVTGTVFEQGTSGGGMDPRALFVRLVEKGPGVSVYSAEIDTDKKCWLLDGVFADNADQAVIFDATLHYMFLTTRTSDYVATFGNAGVVTLFEIPWAVNKQGQSRAARARQVTVLANGDDAEAVRTAAGSSHVDVVNSWATPGGVGLSVHEHRWRMVSAGSAIPMRIEDKQGTLDSLVPATGECENLESMRATAGAKNGESGQDAATMYQDSERHCIEIAQYSKVIFDGSSGISQETRTMPDGMTQFAITVFDKPATGDLSKGVLPIPIASLTNFGLFKVDQPNWYVGKAGQYDGWIVMRTELNAQEHMYGAPWSTNALMALLKTIKVRGAGSVPGATPATVKSSAAVLH